MLNKFFQLCHEKSMENGEENIHVDVKEDLNS